MFLNRKIITLSATFSKMTTSKKDVKPSTVPLSSVSRRGQKYDHYGRLYYKKAGRWATVKNTNRKKNREKKQSKKYQNFQISDA